MNLIIESRRTQPDYFAFVPRSADRATAATGNEHFLVEKLANGHLFAVWTQSSFEGAADQHIVYSRSFDGGRNWAAPITLAGHGADDGIASWAFPLVSRSGRIYVIFSRHMGVNDVFTHTTGALSCIFTDDEGVTWSQEAKLAMPRSIWDNPDPVVPPNCIIWQKPFRLPDGRHFTGLTRWVSPSVLRARNSEWWASPAVVEFLRFENIDSDPDPADLEISFLSGNDRALRVGLRDEPSIPQLQEPSIVCLPDGRLFCVMRSTLGSPFYSVSADLGDTWTPPEPLRQYDDGPIIPHPLSPCPIYPVNDTDYVLIYHNHDGHFQQWTPADTAHHRRPICLARGAFRPDSKQPVWFSEPWYFMDNGGIPILRKDLAMYASVTKESDGIVLWYPERKFFLLGKKIASSSLRELSVPLPEEASGR